MKPLTLESEGLILVWLACRVSDIVAAPVGTAFTYQGRLKSAGQPDAGSVIAGDYVIEGGFWSDLEAGAPGLTIELVSPSSVLVGWPAPSDGFVLQQNTNLATTNWVTVTNSPVVANGEKQVTVSPTVGNRFYRLKYQP